MSVLIMGTTPVTVSNPQPNMSTHVTYHNCDTFCDVLLEQWGLSEISKTLHGSGWCDPAEWDKIMDENVLYFEIGLTRKQAQLFITKFKALKSNKDEYQNQSQFIQSEKKEDSTILHSTITIAIETTSRKWIILNGIKVTETVFDIKMRIQKQENIYHETFNLQHQDKELLNTKTLLEEGLAENVNITLRSVLKSGGYRYLRIYPLNQLLCDGDLKIVNQTEDKLYEQMISKWYKSCNLYINVLNIEHVLKINKNYSQNMNVYDALMNAKKKKNNNKIREDMLFHGTSFENINKIIHGGFNRDYNVRGKYGKGTYFSNRASISADYCKEAARTVDGGDGGDGNPVYAMLACRVYIGESVKGRENMRDNELFMNDKVTRYDSLVNHLDNPSIFVINRDYHAIPCYIILFTVQPK